MNNEILPINAPSTKGMVKNMSWDLLCPKCRKRYVKSVIPRVKRYLRNKPSTPLRSLAIYYGIPRTTLLRALKKSIEEPDLSIYRRRKNVSLH